MSDNNEEEKSGIQTSQGYKLLTEVMGKNGGCGITSIGFD